MVEKEFKKVVSKKEFEKLLNLFGYEKKTTQVNIYYTNETIKYEYNLSVRVRCVNGKMLLQVKEPICKGGALNIKREYEKDIKSIDYIIRGNELNELTRKKGYKDVYLLGFLVTERYIKKIKEYNCEIAFDKNTYLGKEDYEIELEYSEDIPIELVDMIGFQDAKTAGKYHRYITEYDRIIKHKRRMKI